MFLCCLFRWSSPMTSFLCVTVFCCVCITLPGILIHCSQKSRTWLSYSPLPPIGPQSFKLSSAHPLQQSSSQMTLFLYPGPRGFLTAGAAEGANEQCSPHRSFAPSAPRSVRKPLGPGYSSCDLQENVQWMVTRENWDISFPQGGGGGGTGSVTLCAMHVLITEEFVFENQVSNFHGYKLAWPVQWYCNIALTYKCPYKAQHESILILVTFPGIPTLCRNSVFYVLHQILLFQILEDMLAISRSAYFHGLFSH